MESLSSVIVEIGKCVCPYLKNEVAYLVRYGKKVDELKERLENLEPLRNDIERSVDEACRKDEVIDDVVSAWLTKVYELEHSRSQIEAEVQQHKRCCKGCCPDWSWRYRLGKKAAKKAAEVEALRRDGNFNSVSRPLPPETSVPMPVEAGSNNDAIMKEQWGGSGPTAWSFDIALAITKIKIGVGSVICSISFQYRDGEIARWSPRYGGPGGKETEIELGPDEFIVSMSGYHGPFARMTVIYQLAFVTTSDKYGPYGRAFGTKFVVSKSRGWITGFHGCSGTLLNAIGVYQRRSFITRPRETQSGLVKIGPWGELRPQNLKDINDTPTHLIKIIIRHSRCIESIRFWYIANGVAKWSSTWGSDSGSTAQIELGTHHYLRAISGHYGYYRCYIVIRSLTFVSTMGTHGPYGQEEGTAFSLPVKDGKVVAFFGRAGQWLDALGFYLMPN